MKTNLTKYLLVLLLVPVMQACPPILCETITINYPPLSKEDLEFVPYANGDTIKFMHSEGAKIHAFCTREKDDEFQGDYEYCTQYSYETEQTTLTFDYPMSDFELRLVKYDSINVGVSIYFSTSSISNSMWLSDKLHDSLYIDGKLFKQVYALAFDPPYYWEDSFQMYADSLYYSAGIGVIKIGMSNGEYFMVDED